MITLDRARALLDGVDVVTDGSGPVVALAHGAAGGVRENFDPLIAAGRDRHTFTGAHHPGSGATPVAPRDLTLDLLADRLVAAGRLAGGERFPVVGLSFGAAVAATAALRHPEHVSALVTTVGAAHPDPQIRSAVDAVAALHRGGHGRAAAQVLLVACSTASVLETLSPAAHDAAVEEVEQGMPPGGVDQLLAASRADATSGLGGISVPTLVVVAEADRLVLPATQRAFAAVDGAAVISYPDAGHIFDTAQAARWSRDVLDFLDARTPAA